MTLYFPALVWFLAWKVGFDSEVRVWMDTIMDCSIEICILDEIVQILQHKGWNTLSKFGDLEITTMWK